MQITLPDGPAALPPPAFATHWRDPSARQVDALVHLAGGVAALAAVPVVLFAAGSSPGGKNALRTVRGSGTPITHPGRTGKTPRAERSTPQNGRVRTPRYGNGHQPPARPPHRAGKPPVPKGAALLVPVGAAGSSAPKKLPNSC